MKDKSNMVLYCFGGIIVIWFALLIAPYISGGLVEIIEELPKKLNKPFNIEICKDSLKTVFIFLVAYILGIGIYKSTRRNYRKGKVYEYGKVDKNSGIITELTFEEIQKIKDIKYTEEIDENIDFEILSEEDIENYIYMEELENEKNKKDNE